MRVALPIFLLVICGCATGGFKNADPKNLAAQVCQPRNSSRVVKGSVWLKARSKDASGSFPAVVDAISPGSLKLEVTNLLGGTEAIISVDQRKYLITVPNKKERREEGVGYWGGIPLQWATDLFLGYTPCPGSGQLSEASFGMTGEGDLVIDTPPSLGNEAERFTYRFRKWSGKPWVESMKWQRKGAMPLVVDFKFDDPEEASGVPRKWEAKSAQGEVKVRWKDREMTR